MNFELTKEQSFVRQLVRNFAETEVEPLAAEIDAEHSFPVETVEKMAKYGLLGVPFPTQYGGAGGDHISYAITVEELSRVCEEIYEIHSEKRVITYEQYRNLLGDSKPLNGCNQLHIRRLAIFYISEAIYEE